MRLIESRTTFVLTYTALAILLLITLFPIALLVLNSLKPAAQIVPVLEAPEQLFIEGGVKLGLRQMEKRNVRE